MLAKKNRTTKKVVKKIFEQGRSIRSDNLTFRFILTDSPIKISFIVPKTVLKSAVARNLLKRRGFAVFKKYLNTLNMNFSGTFIFNKKSPKFFSGRKSKTYSPVKNLEKEIKFILNKIKQ